MMARMSGTTYRICFVCTGNICRSPMAEAVLRGLLDEQGLGHAVEVDSAGTTSWHVGDPADRRAVTALREAGYDGSGHRAQAFERSWLDDRDLVVALDSGHLDELRALAAGGPHGTKVRLLRSFAVDGNAGDGNGGDGNGVDGDDGDLDVADPYYGSAADFERVLAQVEAGCRGIIRELVRDGVVEPV
jgi:protein-tyrosine phosphatase